MPFKDIEQRKEYEKQRANLPHRVVARKQYAQTPEGKAARSRAQKAYRARSPEKFRARRLLRLAIQNGAIERPSRCQQCSQMHPKIEAHHADYSKPLEVLWVCEWCHKEIHRIEAEELAKAKRHAPKMAGDLAVRGG